MGNLYQFLLRFRAFIFFVALQMVCFWLIVRNNQYQSAAFFTTSNQLVGFVLATSDNVNNYFALEDQNKSLVMENARLKETLAFKKQDTMAERMSKTPDSVIEKQYNFIDGKVINKSVHWANNYLTINRGTADGIENGMGVISSNGVVGVVKASSKHFSTITSLLHSKTMVSSLLKRTGDLCSTSWDGELPTMGTLQYLPRHVNVKKGDTVITSGYNAVFDNGTMVGIVAEVALPENAAFYNIKLKLATDFNKLSYVYVIKNSLKIEKDSLEQSIIQ